MSYFGDSEKFGRFELRDALQLSQKSCVRDAGFRRNTCDTKSGFLDKIRNSGLLPEKYCLCVHTDKYTCPFGLIKSQHAVWICIFIQNGILFYPWMKH